MRLLDVDVDMPPWIIDSLPSPFAPELEPQQLPAPAPVPPDAAPADEPVEEPQRVIIIDL